MLDDNPNMEAREGWIEVRLMDQLSQRIVVKQNGRGSLITLSKSLIYFNVNGGETTLDVFTNVEWDTDIQTVDGLTFIKVDKNHLKVKVGKNTTGAERRKTVTLTSSENKEVKAQLEVVQTNVEKMLSISLSDEEKDMVTMKTGGEVQIPVSLNVKYECVASDNSWIKFTDIPEFSESYGRAECNKRRKKWLHSSERSCRREGYRYFVYQSAWGQSNCLCESRFCRRR